MIYTSERFSTVGIFDGSKIVRAIVRDRLAENRFDLDEKEAQALINANRKERFLELRAVA